MPNVKKEQARFQFKEFNYWEHIFSLIPKDDQEMRKEIDAMIKETVKFTIYDQPEPDGEFIVKNRDGEKVTVNGEQLIYGAKDRPAYIPVDDPVYADFFERKLDLLDRIEEKYHGKGHEILKQEIGILRCKNQNLSDGIGIDFSPGYSIITGANGVQKLQDVLYTIEKDQKNKSDDRMKWSLNDPAIVEKTMKDFGITDIQKKHKEIHEHNAEWAKEWFMGQRDPKKLREIGKKFKKDVKELDACIKNFEKKYIEDMKLPEKDRKIYNITTRHDCKVNDLIILDDKMEGRGINGKNWEDHKVQFAEELERQLITAELDAVRFDKSVKLPKKLKETIDSYIAVTNAHFDQDGSVSHYGGNFFNSDGIAGIRRLMDVRAEAAKTPKDKGAKKIIELADRHLNDPANAAMVEKAKKINQEFAEKGKKIADLTKEVHEAAIDNGNRLMQIYDERKLGGTGTLRFYRSTVAAMQYFNKDDDETVLKGMRTLMNNPENVSPEVKQEMARELEKFFKGVMEFDNKKCEFHKYEELWTDPKHKDLNVMTAICMECEPLIKQYQVLMNDPQAKCALDQNMFKEVKSKMGLLETELQVSLGTDFVAKMYSHPGMADFSMSQLTKATTEEAGGMYKKIKDQGFIELMTFADGSKKTITPNQSFMSAVNKERTALGLKAFTDENVMNDRYKEIIDTINKAASKEKVKEEAKVEVPAVEEVKVEAPAVEEVKVEAPAVEEVKVEAPAVEEVKVEVPAQEEAKIEAPAGQNEPVPDDEINLNFIDEKKMQADFDEIIKNELGIDIDEEELKVDAPVVEEVKAEAPAVEEVKAEAPAGQNEPVPDDVINLNVIDENEIEYPKPEEIREQTAKKLDELTAARDVKGFVSLMNDIRREYMREGKTEKEEMLACERQTAVSDYFYNIGKKGGKEELSKEERKFCLDVYDENAAARSNACVDLGKRIDEAQEEIHAGGFKDTELLVDNPKVVRTMAQQYVTTVENGNAISEFRVANANIQDMNMTFSRIKFDDEEMSFNVDGTGYEPSELFEPDSTERLLEKHNWKQMYDTFKNREDVSLDKLGQYNDYGNTTGDVATSKYNIGIGQKDGHIEITELPRDIQKIRTSTPEELQKYRDEFVEDLGALNVAKEAVKPIAGWAERTLAALDQAHPQTDKDKQEFTDMRDALKTLKEIDSGSTVGSAVIDLRKAAKTAGTAAEKIGDSTIKQFAQNIKSFAESKLPEFEDLPGRIKSGYNISSGISMSKETIRRIDKYAELNGIELKKNDELNYAPDTDRRIEAVSRMLHDAKKGVWGGSKEYDNAAKSFEEMAKAYKSFREMSDKTTDAERMKAIEDYHEAANKARLDLDKYLKYRAAKGPLENNRDVKTQRRIDSINAAINTLQDTNVFMDDRYTEATRKMLAADNKVVTAQLQAERAEKQKEYSDAAADFRRGLENKPSYLEHLIKGVNDALDTLGRISSGNPDAALTDAEKEEAQKAMAAITLYTTYDHAKKNDKGFAVPLTEDRLNPMIDKLASQSAFAKVASGIETKEDIRKVMANPEELRQKYTLAAVAEKQQQKKNGNIQAENKDQPRQEMKQENNREKGMNKNN